MAARIEDYALIGDCETAALVARDGSIDWLCFPRFDSPACFAALLGTPDHGRWLLAPAGTVREVRRQYRANTLILETTFTTNTGAVTVIDFMPERTAAPNVIRVVEGQQGQVPMQMELVIRFDYGSIVPWVRRIDHGIRATAGPDTLYLRTPVPLRGMDFRTVAEFTVRAGQRIPFILNWCHTHHRVLEEGDPEQLLEKTENTWRDWVGKCTYQGEWREAVVRALITLRALIYARTGGIVAAATTSLPELIGSVRNWDYRYCWLRDATFSLYALLSNGYTAEAEAWRGWLVDAVAGEPSKLQMMYGLAGERRLTELELPWLPGYEDSRPVRIGNAAHGQFQLDVYGEVMGVLYLARRKGLPPDENAWRIQRVMMDFLEKGWKEPDEGIWEVRGPRRHFTHSKVMAWTAVDRAIKTAEQFQAKGPLAKWRALRTRIRRQVIAKGFDKKLNSFVQYYGSTDADASLLMLPLVGFLPADDPRIVGTVAYIKKQLLRDGFLARYPTREEVDGLPPGEGVFLLCTFWLADALAQQGHTDEAREIFERLLNLRNDIGLLSEEYDPKHRRLLGNFPQAFSHVGLINTARNLTDRKSAVGERSRE
jgi:GH15 family glucan-1,4-alpha-glucosidase